MDQDTHRCAICGADFASTEELVRHERARHAHQGIGGVRLSNQSRSKENGARKTRQGREFDRRNSE